MENNNQGLTPIFFTYFNELTNIFPERSRNILRFRYNIGEEKIHTLEEIGTKNGITRERVRQIINESMKKIRHHFKDSLGLTELKETITLSLRKNSGIIREERLIALLGKNNVNESGSVRFFLDLFEEFLSVKIPGKMKRSRTFADFDFEQWKKLIDKIIEILEKNGKPMTDKELIDSVLQSEEKNFDEKKIRSFLDVSIEISSNGFKHWGVSSWKEIKLKGTRERAHIVLSEAGEPLHFREIAKHIDLHKLSPRATHPQTVHNELIKDERFVLVGRGIYALKEWGYESGTVKDVVTDILKKARKPLSKETLINEVLTVRKVKRSTVVINLNNHFKKTKNDLYLPQKN